MNFFIVFLCILFFISCFVYISQIFIEWETHQHMVKMRGDVEEYGYANFQTFLEEFEKRNWKRNEEWPTSYFGEDSRKDYIHAGIIKFDNKGMILDFISFWHFYHWSQKNKLIPENKFKKDLWK